MTRLTCVGLTAISLHFAYFVLNSFNIRIVSCRTTSQPHVLLFLLFTAALYCRSFPILTTCKPGTDDRKLSKRNIKLAKLHQSPLTQIGYFKLQTLIGNIDLFILAYEQEVVRNADYETILTFTVKQIIVSVTRTTRCNNHLYFTSTGSK